MPPVRLDRPLRHTRHYMSDTSGLLFLSLRNNSQISVEKGTKMNGTNIYISPKAIGYIRRSKHDPVEHWTQLYALLDRDYPGSTLGPGHSKKD